MAIACISGDDSVMAVENGTVINVQPSADGKSVITMQHGEGYLSVY
jgi:hypothetical protein